jgi:hypothetical protein
MNKSIVWLTIIIAESTLFGGCTAIKNSPVGGVLDRVPGVAKDTRPKVTEEMLKDITDPLVRKNMVATLNSGKMRIKVTYGAGKDQYTTISETDMSTGGYNSKITKVKNGQPTEETIYLGDTTYTKDYKDNQWWKETFKPEAMPSGEIEQLAIPTPPDVQEEAARQAQSTYKQVGQEACGESAPTLTCYVYLETASEKSGTRKFWFDTKEFLTRKEEQEMTGGKILSLLSYDGINVMAPSPVKEVPAGKSIYEVMGEQQFLEQSKSAGDQPEAFPEEPVNDNSQDNTDQ